MRVLLTALIHVFALTTILAQTDLKQNTWSREKLSLNGKWNVIVDPYDNGSYSYRLDRFDEMSRSPRSAYYMDAKVKDKTDRLEYNFDTAETLMVPGSWNMQNDKYYWYEGSMWYRRLFTYEKKTESNRVFVRFEGANYHTHVYLNGKKLGQHVGGFTPFEFDVTDVLREGENSLVVVINNMRHRDGVPTVNTDWFNYGGLTRDVFVYELPEKHVADYKIQLKKDQPKEIGVEIATKGLKAGEMVTLNIPELRINKTFAVDAQGKVTTSIKVKKVSYWSPENPKLYNVELIAGNDKLSDKIGFRTIAVEGSKILLNGKEVFLKGISIHEENPVRGDRAFSMDDARTMLGWAKELGCNFVRLAHYPHNENMVRLADEMGMLVWEENPVYWTIAWDNEETYKNAENQLAEVMTRDKNRASVIIWSMANETPPGEARDEFLKRLVSFTRANDNERLISMAMEKRKDKTNKKIMIVDDRFAEFVDLLSFNEYIGWYTGKPEDCDKIQWKIMYDKPVIISEFGGGALAGFHGDEKTQWTEEFQAAIYREQVKMLSKIPQWAGATPWILTDFRSPRRPLGGIQDGYNRKGLISETGDKKKAFYILQKFYESKK
ncbi:MAG: beta galactosidase jelly roll domain-containing protein [Carboxylicivirga sp.]|jgi:beta-glucuronidase|nr:beta galactosidase jelly roll domain-containing protein [Carboxylicivirga sp.]